MSMTMCDRHDPVVYTDYDHRNVHHKCPVCEALTKVAELEEEIGDLNIKINDIEAENKQLIAECENYNQLMDSDGGDR